MKPPPPMLPALGRVTASAKAVATAASTALPPRARTDAPASQAGADVHTTRPSLDETASSGAATGRTAGTATSTASSVRNTFFMRESLPEATDYTESTDQNPGPRTPRNPRIKKPGATDYAESTDQKPGATDY